MDATAKQKHIGKANKEDAMQTTSVAIRLTHKEKIDYFGFLVNSLLKFLVELSAALQSPEK